MVISHHKSFDFSQLIMQYALPQLPLAIVVCLSIVIEPDLIEQFFRGIESKKHVLPAR